MAFRVIDSRRHGRGKTLPGNLAAAMGAISGTYTKDRVLELSGLPGEIFGKLFIHLHVARKTLILGTTAGSFGAKGLQTDIAVNLLYMVFDPDPSLIDFTNRHRSDFAARKAIVIDFFSELQGDSVDLLLLNKVNPALPCPQELELGRPLRVIPSSSSAQAT